MALFNSQYPLLSPQMAKPRTFTGSGWNSAKLSIAGYKKDGSKNGWGQGVNAALPVVLGIISAYYTGSYKLGSEVGGLVVKGMDAGANKTLTGTDSQVVAKQQAAKGDQIRSVTGSVGGAIGGIYNSLGGEGKLNTKNGSPLSDGSILGSKFNNLESRNLLNQVSDQSIQDYLSDEGLLGSLGSNSDTGQQSSITGMLGDGILALSDNKKQQQQQLPSSLPYNMFGSKAYFADGGELTKEQRDHISSNVGFNDDKTGLLADVKLKGDMPAIQMPTVSSKTKSIPDTANEAFRYLVEQKGLKDTVAAGFVGNLIQESGLNTLKIHDQNTGLGIAGWRDPSPGIGRKTSLLNYLKANGRQTNDLQAQLDFLVDEATKRGDIQRAEQFSTPQEASVVLSKYYFRPNAKSANNQARASNAFNVLRQNAGTMKLADGGELVPYVIDGETIQVNMKDVDAFVYPKEDKETEDYYMIDKRAASHFGVDDLLSAMAWAEGRYGERIMDQESNLIMKSIMKSDRTEEDKKRLLGAHVLSELYTHPIRQVGFAEGGESSPSRSRLLSGKSGSKTKYGSKDKIDNSFIISTASKEDVIAAKKLYNDWARKNGVAPVPVDSKMNNSTATAFANYNADQSNLRKLNTTGSKVVGSNGNTQYLVKSLGLTKMMPDIDPLAKIVGFDKNGKRVIAPANQTVTNVIDPITKKVAVVNDDYLSARVPGWTQQPLNATTNGVNLDALDTTQAAREKQFNTQSAIRSGIAGIEGIAGALYASEPIPTYTPPAEYNRMRDEIYQNRNQGFSSVEQSAINQGLARNYAQGVQGIRNVVGNGGNQSAVLASLGGLSQNLDNSYLAAAQQDVNLRRQNQALYRNQVMNDLNLDRQLFQTTQNNALETRKNGLAMVQDGAQRLFDESQYRADYGPDSLYNEYLTSQSERQRRANETAKLQADAFARNLAGTLPKAVSPGVTASSLYNPTAYPATSPLALPIVK